MEHIPRPIFAALVLHVDTFVQGSGEPYLLSVSTRLRLTMVQPLGPSSTGATLLAALKHQLSAYKVENFSVTHILTDGDSRLRKVADEILALGVRLDATGAGEHVPTVEAKIRVVKERTRAVLASVPYKLPLFLLKWAVMYSAMRLIYVVLNSLERTKLCTLLVGGRMG